ncbi:MAG: hypothetical protein NXH81_03865 [Halieaceae bacterium]|jgi:hypothetical protein|uniref:hypothetical protein n=1 Tax=Haliea alexandrii TaxID=2448162 RepID=UPI000F0AF831|nr:hypothetical protein [Haliea alexandrii]MCR9184516.1 hypothetical protein [Halieaceae bacterium]
MVGCCRIFGVLCCALASLAVQAQYDIDTRLPTCDNFAWSQAVHDSYPDIEQICRGIYQRDGVFYAQAEVEVLRVSGNRMTVRTVHVDGSAGHQTTVRVGPQWRALIDGKSLRAGELIAGQRLTVYIPQHSFELTSEAGAGLAEEAAPASGDGASAQ